MYQLHWRAIIFIVILLHVIMIIPVSKFVIEFDDVLSHIEFLIPWTSTMSPMLLCGDALLVREPGAITKGHSFLIQTEESKSKIGFYNDLSLSPMLFITSTDIISRCSQGKGTSLVASDSTSTFCR